MPRHWPGSARRWLGRDGAQTSSSRGQAFPRTLLADSDAGSRKSGFELILEEDYCLLCGGFPAGSVQLAGAYRGAFPRYNLSVQVPAVSFGKNLRVVGVPSVPAGFDGIACFGFLESIPLRQLC